MTDGPSLTARPLRWPVILLLGVLALGLFASIEAVEKQDRALVSLAAFREGSTQPAIIAAAQWITWMGDAAQRTIVAFLLAGILALRKRLRAALVLLVAVPLAGVASSLLKEIFARDRPEAVPHLDLVTSLSYPSGHAVNAMTVLLLGALLLAQRNRAFWIGLALVGALVVGTSRLLLGVHYPTDILGGWLLGVAASLIGWRVALVWEAASDELPIDPEPHSPSEESPGQ